MRVYADVVFAINLVMDIFILWIVAKLRARYVTPWRLAAAGVVMSGLYCLMVFAEALRMYLNIFSAVLILALGIMICFRPRSVTELATLAGLAHVAAFALGGVGMALFYFTNVGDILGEMLTVGIRNFSLKLLVVSTCIFYILIRLFARWAKEKSLRKQAFYPIKITCGKSDASLTALVDTGNSLRDPITRVPVIIAEFDAVKDFLPEGLRRVFDENKENDLGAWVHDLGDTAFAGRLRMIPFASLGSPNGMLLGFRPDCVEVVRETRTDTYRDVVVGIYNFSLSSEGRYQGLLSPELAV